MRLGAAGLARGRHGGGRGRCGELERPTDCGSGAWRREGEWRSMDTPWPELGGGMVGRVRGVRARARMRRDEARGEGGAAHRSGAGGVGLAHGCARAGWMWADTGVAGSVGLGHNLIEHLAAHEQLRQEKKKKEKRKDKGKRKG
uniref:Uncharacterized protein n=1 Tax=Oryza sativa subsp. japonica TaxID=39947 RepID=Q6Z6B7_ORYSJ|nr:hypothetical protein [Oryza sativa Japonica Group]